MTSYRYIASYTLWISADSDYKARFERILNILVKSAFVLTLRKLTWSVYSWWQDLPIGEAMQMSSFVVIAAVVLACITTVPGKKLIIVWYNSKFLNEYRHWVPCLVNVFELIMVSLCTLSEKLYWHEWMNEWINNNCLIASAQVDYTLVVYSLLFHSDWMHQGTTGFHACPGGNNCLRKSMLGQQRWFWCSSLLD